MSVPTTCYQLLILLTVPELALSFGDTHWGGIPGEEQGLSSLKCTLKGGELQNDRVSHRAEIEISPQNVLQTQPLVWLILFAHWHVCDNLKTINVFIKAFQTRHMNSVPCI